MRWQLCSDLHPPADASATDLPLIRPDSEGAEDFHIPWLLSHRSVLFPSAPPPAASIFSPHISKHAAGANTRLLVSISSNHLPLAPSATPLFQSGPPSSRIYSTHNAEELIESNLSWKTPASAVPYLVPSKGCSVPASSPLFVPWFLLDQTKTIIN